MTCFFSGNNFAHVQTLYRMRSLCRSYIYIYMNIMRVNIECFTGCKRIKQRRISFVPGYLRMILWKISTAFSIKHRIFATFNIKKINSDSLYAFRGLFFIVEVFNPIYLYYLFHYYIHLYIESSVFRVDILYISDYIKWMLPNGLSFI
jgi:hypothetical protein